MANIRNFDSEIGANFIGDDAQPSLTFDNSSTGYSLSLKRTTSNATVSPLEVVASANASAPAMAFNTAGFVSCTSIILTTVAHTDYAIRVWINGQPRWIPTFKDAAIIGGAAYA